MDQQHNQFRTGNLWPVEAPSQQGMITAFCDGGARGNPGPAGFGVYIQDEHGAKVAELSEYLGFRTNNFAEYSGLLAALEFALDMNTPGSKSSLIRS